MTQFLRKNAKIIYILFAVFCFAFILLACAFMTPYSRIAVDYEPDFETTGVAKNILGLNMFCKGTGIAYGTLYSAMFYTNKSLQLANYMVLYLGVVSLVMVAIMLICANASRKKYYISNLVSGIACPAVSIIMAIVAIVTTGSALGDVAADTELLGWGSIANANRYDDAIKWFNEGDLTHLTVSTTPLVIYIVVMILFVIASGALIAYNVFRYLDTKKQLMAAENENLGDVLEVEEAPIEDAPADISQEKVVDANV